jgi:hypothetical protein
MGKSGDTKDLIENLRQLQKVLRAVSAQKDALDNKIAEYIFFPLSTVLKQLEKIPLHARELTFECILILLQTAWSRKIAPELGMQLLILYTFVVDQKGSKSSEEFQTVLYKSMAIVITALGADQKGKEALMSAQSVPHLGKAVSVILDGTLDGPSEDVQISAISALDAFCRAVPDRDALGTSFLPGIMSCLAKVLSFKGAKTTSKALAAALNVLTYLLPLLFRDDFTNTLPEGGGDSSPNSKGLNKSWLRATVPQVKAVLANILKLQRHDRQIVRLALGKLCSTLLQECATSLSTCVSMLLEACLTLATQEETVQAELKHLLSTSTPFAETLQSSLHYWILSLPRMMESADETKKQRRIHQITLAFRLLNEQGLNMGMVNRDLANNLRDSVAGAIKYPKGVSTIAVFETTPLSLALVRGNSTSSGAFEPIIAMRKSQMDTVKELAALAHQISSSDDSLVTAQDLVSSIHGYSGDLQIASFWLTLNMVRNAFTSEMNMDDFLTFGDNAFDTKKDLLEQLYDFSISILSDRSLTVDVDWRLQALALEAVALQASQQKEAFRGELIDALYPVLHHMGASVPALQNHAVTCLNIIAHECGYKNSGELIVGNVDYLVNAVALRLNTFDISPQAPQVLLMMVKLAGPSLLPYLDDTVDSIFVALESFHGYPKLVDLLFSVLKVIVEEGAKASQLTITSGDEAEAHRKRTKRGTSIEGLVALIQDVRTRYTRKSEVYTKEEKLPEEPWGSGKQEGNGSASPEGDGEITGSEAGTAKPPAPRTYSLLLNISKLTQHYLTASSSGLRTSLLDLLSASFPALAKHEDSFLPLINTLWPVLLPRLSDSEPYVVAGSLRVIGLMCKYAGDFMSGRVDEAWPQMKKLYRLRTGRAGDPLAHRQRGTASSTADITSIVSVGKRKEVSQPAVQHYIDAPSRIIWEALVSTLVDVITYTATNDVLFDDVLEMLAPVITSRPEVRQALELRNADAVWLALFRLEAKSTEQRSKLVANVAPLKMPLASSGYQWAPLR